MWFSLFQSFSCIIHDILGGQYCFRIARNSAQLVSIGCLLFFSCLFLQFSGSNSNQAADLILCASICNNPVDIAIDPTDDDLFVPDHRNSRVLRFGPFLLFPPTLRLLLCLSNPILAPAHLAEAQQDWTTCGQYLWTRRALPGSPMEATTVSFGSVTPASCQMVLRLTVSWASPIFPMVPWLRCHRDGRASGIAGELVRSLWVTDSSHNRVLQFDDASTLFNCSAANGILGQLNFDSHLTGPAPNRMTGPNKLRSHRTVPSF